MSFQSEYPRASERRQTAFARRRRFVVIAYCVFASVAGLAALGVRHFGQVMGMDGQLSEGIASAFAMLAAFNILALLALDALLSRLRRN